MSLENFRTKLKEFLRQGGYSQKQLASEMEMHPAQLSNKLNEHNYASLTNAEAKQIVKILAGWCAINTRQEALDLLAEVNLGFNSFNLAEWNRAPLDSLVENLPQPHFMATLPTTSTPINLRLLELNNGNSPSQFLAEKASNLTQPRPVTPPNALELDWLDPPVHFKTIYGRKKELAWLEEQICDNNARLVGLVGNGGIGKTTLAFEFTQKNKHRFEKVIWYSLHNAPPLETTLAFILNTLLRNEPYKRSVPVGLNQQLIRLLECLRQSRCLIILDNFETVLADNTPSGVYLSGYEGYGQLLELIAQQPHQSVVLLTSRDKPKELVMLETRYPQTVTNLTIPGLNVQDGRELLKAVGNIPIEGTHQEWERLIGYYFGNPLALKLLAEPLQTLFGGNIKEFLQEGWGVFAEIGELLRQQFDHLSELEQQTLYWLAVERQTVSLEELKKDFHETIFSKDLVEALISLKRRSLIESSEKAGYFGLQPVILEYLSERLVTEVVDEIIQAILGPFLTHYSLLKAETKDYIRESQRNLIILPVLEKLKKELNQRERVSNRLLSLVADLRQQPMETQGYAAGNLINLLVGLKVDLSKADFSGLRIWQAYLQGVVLEGVNFTGSDLRGSLFTYAFGAVEAVAFSPNGRFLASGGLDGAVRLWEVSTGQCLEVFEGHSSRVWSVAFSLNGQFLASSSTDQSVRLWNISDRKKHATLLGHFGEINTVVFSPDGKLVASSSSDHTVRIWEITSGRCLKILTEHSNEVWSVAFSPDSKLLASGSADQTIRLWEVDSGQCLKLLALGGDNNWVWSVAFSPDGKLLASSSSDQTIRLWEVESGVCRNTLLGHTNRVYSVAFSPDGKLLASGSSDQTIRLWKIETAECYTILQGHLNLIKSLSFSSDGKLLASGSPDQTIRLWEIESGRCLRIYQGYSNRINSLAYSPDGKFVASGSDDNTIRLWEVAKARCYQTLTNASFVKSIAVSPDGKLLASGGADNLIRLWDIASGTCLKTLRGYPSWVWSVVFSLDGQILINSGNDRNIYVWEVASGQCLKILEGHSGFIRKVALSPRGTLLASASNDYSVRLWDSHSSRCLKTFEGHSDQVLTVAFSQDGQFLASGSADHTIRLWNLTSGQCLKVLQDHDNWVWVVGFTPDGQYLVSSGYDGKVKVWDTKNWQPLFDLQGHKEIIRALAFAPTGGIVAGGYENYLRLWNLQTSKQVFVLKNPGLYEGLNITGVTGLDAVQEGNLKLLGAVENTMFST